jgi:hypothetical protein
MMSERDRKDEERGFTVVDRRGGAEESSASAAPSGTPAAAPRFDFSMLVQSFAITALHHLGRIPDPATGQPGVVDLVLAQQNIDILDLLDAKTRGNLEADESRLLASLLYEVRMHYVEATKQGR